jgi:hypothetical protein
MEDLKSDGNVYKSVLSDLFKEILTDQSVENAFQGFESAPTPLYMLTSDDPAPGFSYLSPEQPKPADAIFQEDTVQAIGKQQYALDSLYTDADLVQFWASIVENAVFNTIQECTYGHTDLSAQTKIYLKKKEA